MHSILVSDLHLWSGRPHIVRQFFDFVEHEARAAQAFYILGDLFEYWVGDDDTEDALGAAVSDALRGLGAAGVGVFLMQGNRDVLIGSDFAARCGAELMGDPTLLDLHGTATLLMHGDTLCTDDVDYQKFRAYARDPRNQAEFLAQPLAARRRQMTALRDDSERAKREKTAEIMDVSTTEVERVLRAHGYPRLIHGHTHRPARHLHHVDGRACERWVLNDWYERGGYLRCDAGGCRALMLGN